MCIYHFHGSIRDAWVHAEIALQFQSTLRSLTMSNGASLGLFIYIINGVCRRWEFIMVIWNYLWVLIFRYFPCYCIVLVLTQWTVVVSDEGMLMTIRGPLLVWKPSVLKSCVNVHNVIWSEKSEHTFQLGLPNHNIVEICVYIAQLSSGVYSLIIGIQLKVCRNFPEFFSYRCQRMWFSMCIFSHAESQYQFLFHTRSSCKACIPQFYTFTSLVFLSSVETSDKRLVPRNMCVSSKSGSSDF